MILWFLNPGWNVLQLMHTSVDKANKQIEKKKSNRAKRQKGFMADNRLEELSLNYQSSADLQQGLWLWCKICLLSFADKLDIWLEALLLQNSLRFSRDHGQSSAGNLQLRGGTPSWFWKVHHSAINTSVFIYALNQQIEGLLVSARHESYFASATASWRSPHYSFKQ